MQEVTDTFLSYAILTALGSIATQQANPDENTMKKVELFLDYAATHPDAIVTFQYSNMIPAVHSKALYISNQIPQQSRG